MRSTRTRARSRASTALYYAIKRAAERPAGQGWEEIHSDSLYRLCHQDGGRNRDGTWMPHTHRNRDTVAALTGHSGDTLSPSHHVVTMWLSRSAMTLRPRGLSGSDPAPGETTMRHVRSHVGSLPPRVRELIAWPAQAMSVTCLPSGGGARARSASARPLSGVGSATRRASAESTGDARPRHATGFYM